MPLENRTAEEFTRLRREIEDLRSSLNFAAGQLSGMPHNLQKHPEEVLEELKKYGRQANKELHHA